MTSENAATAEMPGLEEATHNDAPSWLDSAQASAWSDGLNTARERFAPIMAEKERERAFAQGWFEGVAKENQALIEKNETLEARALAAEAERDKALALVAEGAYADAHKNEPSIYQHALALTVERLKAAEAALAGERANAVDGSIDIRLDDKGSIDEIFGNGVLCHIERMDKGHWFISMIRPDQTSEAFWLNGSGKVEFTMHEHRPAPTIGPNVEPWTIAAAIRAEE